MLEMVGTIMTARITDALTIFRPVGRSKVSCIQGATMTMSKKPRTTDGIPARSSVIDFSIPRMDGGDDGTNDQGPDTV